MAKIRVYQDGPQIFADLVNESGDTIASGSAPADGERGGAGAAKDSLRSKVAKSPDLMLAYIEAMTKTNS